MPNNTDANVLTSQALLDHWQGHRRLTRRMIEAFPDDKLFSHSVGGMRPFSTLTMEFLQMAAPIARGIATGEWGSYENQTGPEIKAALLKLWDDATAELNEIWPKITAEQFNGMHKAFGQWDGTGTALILYAIDNEIHHRGQGYVFLRSLGIEPPAFYVRA